MINKMILFAFILLSTLSNVFAFGGDSKVFQILRDNKPIACAETDKGYAFCWEPSKGLSKLQISQSERQLLQSDGPDRWYKYAHFSDLIFRDNKPIACAEIDEEYAFCLESSKGFSKLQINQSERQVLQHDARRNWYEYEDVQLCDLSDAGLYVLTLKDLVNQILNDNVYNSNYSRELKTKVRVLGAAIYMNHGHDGMVDVCDNLPRSRGIRRLTESLWDGIGNWFG